MTHEDLYINPARYPPITEEEKVGFLAWKSPEYRLEEVDFTVHYQDGRLAHCHASATKAA